MGFQSQLFQGISMNSFAAVLLLSSAAFAAPKASPTADAQFYQPGFGSYGYGNYKLLPLANFRYANNPVRNVPYPNFQSNSYQNFQPNNLNSGVNNFNLNPSRSSNTIETGFGSIPNQGITPDQRATYLPVMKALLKVMETNRPAVQDINNLMVLTRELNKKVPKGQNLLGNFGNFGIDNLESMGLPETGDIVTRVNGVPHIKTSFGTFPLSDTNLMTSQERAQFLPIVRTFTRVLEKGSADANESQLLLQQASQLTNLIPANMRSSIQQLTGNINPGRSFNF